jgi:hypothetical protein
MMENEFNQKKEKKQHHTTMHSSRKEKPKESPLTE